MTIVWTDEGAALQTLSGWHQDADRCDLALAVVLANLHDPTTTAVQREFRRRYEDPTTPIAETVRNHASVLRAVTESEATRNYVAMLVQNLLPDKSRARTLLLDVISPDVEHANS